MAIQPNKPNSRVFLFLGVLLAALAFGGVLFALNQGKGGGNTVNVVIAKTDISTGTPITADLVTVTAVPPSAASTDVFHDPSQVLGKTTTASVKANTVLVPALFAAPAVTTTSSNGTTTATSVEYSLVKGYVALAIPAAGSAPATASSIGLNADQVSAGYYIVPGDHIDILIDNGSGGVRYAFQDVVVLRVGAATSPGGAASIYMVEVPRGQAELLTSLVTQRTAPNSSTPGPFLIKYVLRPQSEWGKMAPDNSKYDPNYEPSSGPQVPTPADTTVTPGSLDATFGH